jgi:hypothetical protein
MKLTDPELENDFEAQAEVFPDVLNYVGNNIIKELAKIPAIMELKPKIRIPQGSNRLDIHNNSGSLHLYTELTYKYKGDLAGLLIAPVVKDIVIPDFLQRQGIASLIIKSWEKGFTEKGYTGYFLAYDVRDDTGLAFWSSLGYQKSDENQKYQSLMYKLNKES